MTTGSVRRLAWLGCSNAANAKLAELHGCPIPAARALDSSTRHQCRACASVAGIQTRPSGQRRSSGARVLGYATRSGTETRVPNEASAADRRPKKADFFLCTATVSKRSKWRYPLTRAWDGLSYSTLVTPCRHSTTPKNTHSSETAAGFSPPPSTLTTGTLSHTQTFTSSTEVVTAYGGYAITSIRTMRSPIDRSTAKESSFERALTGINPTFDLQRKNQTVRASIRVCA